MAVTMPKAKATRKGPLTAFQASTSFPFSGLSLTAQEERLSSNGSRCPNEGHCASTDAGHQIRHTHGKAFGDREGQFAPRGWGRCGWPRRGCRLQVVHVGAAVVRQGVGHRGERAPDGNGSPRGCLRGFPQALEYVFHGDGTRRTDSVRRAQVSIRRGNAFLCQHQFCTVMLFIVSRPKFRLRGFGEPSAMASGRLSRTCRRASQDASTRVE